MSHFSRVKSPYSLLNIPLRSVEITRLVSADKNKIKNGPRCLAILGNVSYSVNFSKIMWILGFSTRCSLLYVSFGGGSFRVLLWFKVFMYSLTSRHPTCDKSG